MATNEPSPRPLAGACLCGHVRFTLEPPVLFSAHCHCSMCRRGHGAMYVTWIGIPYARFRITAGAERLVRYRSSDHGTRTFCGACGSTLFCESTHHPDWIDIVRATVEDDAGLAPQAHFFFDDRASWEVMADSLPRFGGASGTEPR